MENVTDENLAIHLEGDFVLHATTASSLQVGAKADVKFTTAPGMAPLRLLSSKASAITIASGISLELLGAIHVAIRGRHGILGVGGEGEGLEIARRGSVEINDSEESILRLGSLLFQEGAGILYPYGPLLHSVMLQRKDSEIGGPAVTGYVLIGHNETPLGVELNGVQLTPATLRFHCRRGVVDAGRRRGNSPS